MFLINKTQIKFMESGGESFARNKTKSSRLEALNKINDVEECVM